MRPKPAAETRGTGVSEDHTNQVSIVMDFGGAGMDMLAKTRPLRRAGDANHGMPEAVEMELRAAHLLKAPGPHAPATVRRRLTSWSILTRWRGLAGCFGEPTLKSALRLAVRATGRPRQRKSLHAVTDDILAELIATCGGNDLTDVRDRAILLTAFASGGRRRSELANLRVEDIVVDAPVRADPQDESSASLACLTLQLGRTKTTDIEDAAPVLLIGRPAEALQHWLHEARIATGPVFRAIDKWGNLGRRGLTPQSINLVLKSRCEKAGLDPAKYSAHGLRSGYLTEAANRGVPLQEAMQQSQHKSMAQAAAYYNEQDRRRGKAARVFI
jgi:integrase